MLDTKCNLKYKDIPPDGYIWKKYGQKPDGQLCIKSYFKCNMPGCEAKRLVSINRESGVMESTYVGVHSHSRNVIIQLKANSYEQYLALAARAQQFVYQKQVTNGYAEKIAPIDNETKLSPELPLKISTKQIEFVERAPEVPEEETKYIAQILIAFQCEQDFSGTKAINSLSDPHQQLV